ncbi:MAG TPA: Rieske 2Fe-2S domain-containing protein [Oceanipulchritudo sp.]|nr:Rieske 2Fe-2S domain-containing protein [Oceanipulchritudo sp.]
MASISAIVAVGFAGIRSLIPNVLFEPSRLFKAGHPRDYPDGASTFIEEVRIYIVRRNNQFKAVSAVCPHLGCTVNNVHGEYPFLCPCHGSHFDNQGAVVNGPSPRGLIWLHVSLSKDGRLVVDLDQEVNPDTVYVYS